MRPSRSTERQNRNESDFIPGTNCNAGYKRNGDPYCDKCLERGTHHEYLCPKFYKISHYLCTRCGKGKHWKTECTYRRTPSMERSERNTGNQSASKQN